ncbi:MAG TPA: hypothetical protein VE978_09965, partial [Chitinophagales bacterium]|nr:hypothetical protein [Chitinophagales bacterium]
MKLKLLIAFAMCFLFRLNAKANVYLVTSNADGGPGTLRQAITDANNNAGSDSIQFDLADSSVAGRTIILDSILPSLIGNVTVDGASQLHGNQFGVSYAKIEVTASLILPLCFNIVADSCDIFGFFISGFETGISISNSFVKIGAINRGNVIFNCTSACVSVENADHVIFIANLIGVDTAQNSAQGIVGDGIRINNSAAVAIGGHSTSTSNVISGNNFGIQFTNSSYCNINGNLIGTSGNGLNAIPNSYGIRGSGVNSNINIGGDSLFQRNIISGNTNAGIFGSFSSSVIQGNYIGIDDSGKNPLGNGGSGIYLLSGSSNNLIGGDQQSMSNIIAYNGLGAVGLQGTTCNFNTIRGNSTFCNSLSGFTFNGGNNSIIPPPFSIINANGATGITYPNSTVDIFQDDSCNNCEGKTLIASASTSGNGVYAYNGLLSGMITATVTDSLGNTSEYSSCVQPDSIACIIVQFTTSPDTVCENSPMSFIDQTTT